MSIKRVIFFAATSFFLTELSYPADLYDVKQACGDHRPSGRPGEHWLETCIIDFFTLQPVHPAVNSIATITGTGFTIRESAYLNGRIPVIQGFIDNRNARF
jgi:hypothetical protein